MKEQLIGQTTPKGMRKVTWRDFPRKRAWVIIIKSKSNGIFCPVDKTTIQPRIRDYVSRHKALVFYTGLSKSVGTTSMRGFRREIFEYTKVQKIMEGFVAHIKNQDVNNAFDIYISRVNSKKCPIKVDLSAIPVAKGYPIRAICDVTYK